MKTPADIHDFSNRPLPERISNFQYDIHTKYLYQKWGCEMEILLLGICIGCFKRKHIAIQDIGNGIWKVFFRNVFLGFFDEKHLRNKQKSTRLETNLV